MYKKIYIFIFGNLLCQKSDSDMFTDDWVAFRCHDLASTDIKWF